MPLFGRQQSPNVKNWQRLSHSYKQVYFTGLINGLQALCYFNGNERAIHIALWLEEYRKQSMDESIEAVNEFYKWAPNSMQGPADLMLIGAISTYEAQNGEGVWTVPDLPHFRTMMKEEGEFGPPPPSRPGSTR